MDAEHISAGLKEILAITDFPVLDARDRRLGRVELFRQHLLRQAAKLAPLRDEGSLPLFGRPVPIWLACRHAKEVTGYVTRCRYHGT